MLDVNWKYELNQILFETKEKKRKKPETIRRIRILERIIRYLRGKERYADN